MLRAEAIRARKVRLLVVDEEQRHAAGDRAEHRAREEVEDVVDPAHVRDDVLRLVFLCCHPALAVEARAALTLRLVLGLTTAQVARLFLVSEPTMAARLTRGRKKLAASGIALRLPDPAALDERVESVVRVVYLAFTAGYAPGDGPDVVRVGTAGEAIRLGRLLDELLPGRDDVRCLLALMVLQHSRRDARTGPDGAGRPAPRPGPVGLAPRRDRLGHGASRRHLEPADQPLRRRAAAPGAGRRGARDGSDVRRHRLVARWRRCTRSWRRSPARRWCASTGRSRSPSATAPAPAWPSSTGSTPTWRAPTASPRCAPSCCCGTARTPRPQRSSTSRSSAATTRPSGGTC